MSHDWADSALLDLELMLDHVGKKLPLLDKKTILKWANDTITTKYKPHFDSITKSRMNQVLYPPGNCIHLWRNGIGWSGKYHIIMII